MDNKETQLHCDWTDILMGIFVGLAALALYIRTLAPSLLWGDSAEFQTLSYTLGMSHPSGYMTQIMLGKLFTYIPVGNIAYRVNLMSAFFGALTVAEVYWIVRIQSRERIAACCASLMLAISPLFWARALVAESYAPAAGMITSVWLSFLLWRKTGGWHFLFFAGLLGGLSIGIHSTAVMTAISVLVVMGLSARKRSDWIGAASGALVGVLLTLFFFFYLDHHDPSSSIYNTVYRINGSGFGLTPDEFDTPLERFFTIFPAGHFWSYFFSATSREITRRLWEYLALYPTWCVVLIVTGAFGLLKRNWRDGLYPSIAFLLIWGFAITVEFSVYQEFYTSAAVFVYVWLGMGVSVMFSWLRLLFKHSFVMLRPVAIILSILLIVLPLWNARRDLRLAIRSGYTTFVRDTHLYPVFAKDKAVQDASRIVNRVEENAIVFADWDKLYSYIYTAQMVDGKMGISFHEAWSTDEMQLAQSTLEYIDANIDTRPIYFTLDMPGLEERYNVVNINNTLRRIYRK